MQIIPFVFLFIFMLNIISLKFYQVNIDKRLIWYYYIYVSYDTILRLRMEEQKYLVKIKKVRLFADIKSDILLYALKNARTARYSSGQEIEICKSLAVLLSGSANAYSSDSRRRLLLRRIGSCEVCGVAGLFATERQISRVFSKGESQVLFFDEDTVRYMLENDSSFMYGYISFLSGRIGYLNKKITYLTAGSAERKLALFLDSFGEDRLCLPVNLTSVSDMLGIGRASLYRALDKMVSDGCILRDGNDITILNRQNIIERY